MVANGERGAGLIGGDRRARLGEGARGELGGALGGGDRQGEIVGVAAQGDQAAQLFEGGVEGGDRNVVGGGSGAGVMQAGGEAGAVGEGVGGDGAGGWEVAEGGERAARLDLGAGNLIGPQPGTGEEIDRGSQATRASAIVTSSIGPADRIWQTNAFDDIAFEARRRENIAIASAGELAIWRIAARLTIDGARPGRIRVLEVVTGKAGATRSTDVVLLRVGFIALLVDARLWFHDRNARDHYIIARGLEVTASSNVAFERDDSSIVVERANAGVVVVCNGNAAVVCGRSALGHTIVCPCRLPQGLGKIARV